MDDTERRILRGMEEGRLDLQSARADLLKSCPGSGSVISAIDDLIRKIDVVIEILKEEP